MAVETEAVVIRYDNTWAALDKGAPRAANITANRALSYRPNGYAFVKSYKSGRWDGWVSLMRKDNRFPSGLVNHVATAIQREGHYVAIIDERTPPQPTPGLYPDTSRVSLLDYQEECVTECLRKGRGVVDHAVGSGKTEVMLEVTRRLSVPTLIVLHRKDLLHQTVERAKERLGCEVGIIGDSRWEPKTLTVALFQTLWRRISNYQTREETQGVLNQFQAVMADEVHHIQAKTYGGVMQRLGNAYYRFGFSATPFKSKGDQGTYLTVQAWTGPVVHRLPSGGGIEAGRLVPADLFMVDPGPPKPNNIDYPTAMRTGILEHENRNRLTAAFARVLQQQGPTLVLVQRLEHGQYLADKIGCPFLQGSVEGGERNDSWSRMREGKLPCVVATVIADEGLDIPNISGIILAGGGRSTHTQIQRIGRGMRVSEGKDRLVVIDFADQGKYLGKQAKARIGAYESEPAYVVARVSYDEACQWLGIEETER